MKHRGQVNMFIIAGITVIVIIALLLFYKGKLLPELDVGKEKNPNMFFESCVEGKVKEAISIMSLQGGYIKPKFKISFKFEDRDFEEIPYLCYTENYYVPCVNQEPMLIQHLNEEIKDYVKEDVEDCFNKYILELENANYVVDSSYEGFEVKLVPGRILVNIYGKITSTKTGETSKQENFGVRIPTKFYDLGIVVQEIVSQEAEYCNFDILGFMMLYSDFEIDKFRTGESITIYRLKHKDSKEEFQFAVRSCVIPPGI